MDVFIQGLVAGEDFFDRMGYWPILSSVTGALRIIFGFFVALIGFKLLLGTIIGMIFCYLFSIRRGKALCWKYAQHGVRVMTNGRLNGFRGGIEVIPLLGNILVWSYDRARQGVKLLRYEP